MRLGTRRLGPRIPIHRVNPLNHLDIRRGHRHIIPTGNPVLRASVAKPGRVSRQLGHRVVGVRHAVLRIPVCDVCRQGEVADARLAVCILIPR